MVEHAVAIEEHGGTPQLRVELDIGAGKILRDADVDKIAAIRRSAYRAVGGEHREYVLLERSGQALDPGNDRAIDDIDAGIDRTGRALAGCEEGANPAAIQNDAAE